jgi:hypothetical protein
MLHEQPTRNSATRLFRGEPVLTWTLRRLAPSNRSASRRDPLLDDQAAMPRASSRKKAARRFTRKASARELPTLERRGGRATLDGRLA